MDTNLPTGVNSLVSIIMPVFNAAKYLKESVRSCIEQTYQNWELICVDDCSSDASRDVLLALSRSDRRIHIFFRKQNGGSAAARNDGLRQCQGRYICFLDADDWYRPDFLFQQIRFLQQNGPFVYSSYSRFYQNRYSLFTVREVTTSEECVRGCDISCLTAFYDSSIIGKHFFDENAHMHEDLLYWLQLLSITKVAYGNPEPLAVYRIVEHSKSKKKIKGAFLMWHFYHKRLHFSFFKSTSCVLKVARYSRKKYKNVYSRKV